MHNRHASRSHQGQAVARFIEQNALHIINWGVGAKKFLKSNIYELLSYKVNDSSWQVDERKEFNLTFAPVPYRAEVKTAKRRMIIETAVQL